MNKKEALGLMQSDMKLWEAASTEDVGDAAIKKVINLPWGIGEVEVTLEGLTDAGKKRSAITSYGEYIRGIIDEQINDEAITARASQKAALAGEDTGGIVDGSGNDSAGPRGPYPGKPTKVVDTEAMETLNVITAGPEAVADRAIYVREQIRKVADNLIGLKRELAGLEAYLEVYNNENSETVST